MQESDRGPPGTPPEAVSLSGRRDETPPEMLAWRGKAEAGSESYISALMSVLEDVHQARRELAAEYQKLETTVRALPEGIVLLDRDGEVLVSNDAAQAIFCEGAHALTRGDLRTAAWLPLADIVHTVHERGLAYAADLEARQDPLLVMHVTATPLGREQHGASVLLTITNVTLQRETDRMKDEFLTTVSHELRTPLAFIKLFLSNVFSGAMGPCDEKMAAGAHRADTAVDNLTALIDELFDYTRLTRAERPAEIEEASIIDIVEGVRGVYEPIMAEQGRIFTVESQVTHPRFQGMPGEVRRVITNLLDNATRYTERDGSIKLSLADAGDAICVSITDDGVGIPKEYHDVIFDRFRQVGRSYGPGPRGLGLGLAICKEIVERHGGRIWVESEPGRGSTFSFLIPRERTSGAEPPAAP